MGLTIIGMIGGSLITGLCMYIYYRKRVGLRCALQREIGFFGLLVMVSCVLTSARRTVQDL